MQECENAEAVKNRCAREQEKFKQWEKEKRQNKNLKKKHYSK